MRGGYDVLGLKQCPLGRRLRRIDVDGSPGDGCVLATPGRSQGLSRETLERLFREHGERDTKGRPYFSSRNKLREAMKSHGLASGNSGADPIIQRIERDYCAPEGDREDDRPVILQEGTNSKVYTWRQV